MKEPLFRIGDAVQYRGGKDMNGADYFIVTAAKERQVGFCYALDAYVVKAGKIRLAPDLYHIMGVNESELVPYFQDVPIIGFH